VGASSSFILSSTEVFELGVPRLPSAVIERSSENKVILVGELFFRFPFLAEQAGTYKVEKKR